MVLVGTLLEGESVLLLAGYAAYTGLLELHNVIAVATLGSFMGDQLWFFLGRSKGPAFLVRFPKFGSRIARARELLAKYHAPVILSVRFLYGLRTVLPFVIGMSSISALRFQVLNFLGAVLWSVLGAGAGYLFGNAIEAMLGNMHHYHRYVFLALAVIGFAVFWITQHRKTQ